MIKILYYVNPNLKAWEQYDPLTRRLMADIAQCHLEAEWAKLRKRYPGFEVTFIVAVGGIDTFGAVTEEERRRAGELNLELMRFHAELDYEGLAAKDPVIAGLSKLTVAAASQYQGPAYMVRWLDGRTLAISERDGVFPSQGWDIPDLPIELWLEWGADVMSLNLPEFS